MVNEVVTNYFPITQIKNINIRMKIDSDCDINANIFHIDILLGNIFNNAIKYILDRGGMAVTLQKKDKI
ncbi:MAG: signal transduction histidine kinase [Myxococcota bacterium]